ncbi:alpha/beta hydrolase domain-containing protein [Mycobacterium terramassiliense]|uniref:alpha/beta hydrolase domain-containing protein n=1 Tax=Mycobacterium terramassiliense TaxID=1841859 RepID=UPI0012FF9566|nr:alpha/beta hydrolase domain-containing protein [Mycobacterium terramassiliense]
MTTTPYPAWSADVEGPIVGGIHGWPFGSALDDGASHGYVEEEFFVSGEAIRYRPANELSPQGDWAVLRHSASIYRTRVVVRRPSEPARFNGTVVVEWVNVSAGYDINLAVPPSLFDGLAYVAVSAQPAGLYGFPSVPGNGVMAWDPQRYASLDLPDDAIGYDLFTQIAGMLRNPDTHRGPALLGGLIPRHLIGVGASQSGTRVLAYANAIQPLTHAFDALMPLVCAGMAADFDTALAHPDSAAGHRGHSRAVLTQVRGDAQIPVMAINTETEALHYLPARQSDSERFRYWEIPGASHAPRVQLEAILAVAQRDGVREPAWMRAQGSNVMWLPTFDAAIGHLKRWIDEDQPPSVHPPIEVNVADGAIIRDEFGNALGGVRLPELEVPIATHVGTNSQYELTGTTTPFSPDTLRRLYPTHADYVRRVAAAATTAAAAGVILPRRVEAYHRQAQYAKVPP